MTPDRRSLGLPAFAEPAFAELAADAVVPAQPGGWPRPSVEQGADFRQPPGEDVPEPRAARRDAGLGTALTFSDPDRQI
ncbi:hypothetical protein OG455_05935 [Kitasatospora sp. NBC_01287]|uniref:hypothetical protein n=1 Tax=Kitasatospora sp. NBC_01287 TaxID=2903573 RepID=UPI00225B4DF7|nr:hypothetical protein [Kitasatospora sp. NBC_01287]MCX4745068.1 hypothetical protein [Kitasatospora sp. NBC_01287]